MLTMAVENPPVPRRRSFADFVARLVAAMVLAVCVIDLGSTPLTVAQFQTVVTTAVAKATVTP